MKKEAREESSNRGSILLVHSMPITVYSGYECWIVTFAKSYINGWVQVKKICIYIYLQNTHQFVAFYITYEHYFF